MVKLITAMREARKLAIAVVGAAFFLTPQLEAQLVDDHTPWWLWPEVWTGEFEYDEELHVAGAVNEIKRVTGVLLLDHKENEGCTASWVGSQKNAAFIDSKGAGKMDEQTEVARLHGQSSSSARGRFSLSARSGLTISIEKGAYRVLLSASPAAVVKGHSGATGAVDTSGFSLNSGWQDDGKVSVDFDQRAYSSIPESLGFLEDGVIEEKGTGGAEFKSKFRWVMEPEHDIERWVRRYIDLLESERASFIEMNKDLLEKMECDGGVFEGTPCRAARAALDNVDRRITRLADDCRRLLGNLVNIECDGFARGIRATPRAWQYEHAVCTDPAMTCDVIHRHVFDYFDSGNMGDLVVTYRRLPNHLLCMYDLDEFEMIASLSSTDWLGKLLGQ